MQDGASTVVEAARRLGRLDLELVARGWRLAEAIFGRDGPQGLVGSTTGPVILVLLADWDRVVQ